MKRLAWSLQICPLTGGVILIGRSFGQHEPLTTRLHNLVRSYPKGVGILKEFIQNADDAEADEIVFVIDELQYDVAGLPSSMQWLHTTPALLIYNNRSFRESDIQGIQSIGESGKSESVGKTGRFGLGFNACYNVTDVPCFFTRGDLHFFDPHFQTLQQASLESPGRCFGVDELISEGWPLLDAFRQFVADESGFTGTVFRLPFRTAQQASTSKIKSDAYTVSDALDAVRELQEMGSTILLFLKHIRRLKIEYRNRAGSVVNLLSMHANNTKEINESRVEVNKLLSSSDPEHILTELSRRGQVYSSCRHEYRVMAEGVEHTETWRVIDGFFVDDEDKVVTACRKMIENEEKALPYAGAAWPLDPDHRVAGRVFCFLPVPMQTNIPIQINGYFDLDDSRQNMFLDPSAYGAAGHRVQWNKVLLDNSVVQAYIRLLENLRSDLGTDCIDLYYSAFPNAVTNERSWEGWLTTSFYQQASLAPLFRVSCDTPWSVLSTSRSLPEELVSAGNVLIADEFLPIPYPPLPDNVLNGFKNNKINVPMLTPHDLRMALKEHRDIDCPIDAAPRACLRKRQYVEQILSFCLSDSPKGGISGLPLIIDCRGHLRTLGFTESPLYLIKQLWDLEVFGEYPEWFVDTKLVRDLNLVENKVAGLLDMDSQRFVHELSKYVSAQTDNGELKMIIGSAGILTDKWLQAVVSRLLESNLDKLNGEIKKIPLIPDQNHVLCPMGYASTPLLFHEHKEELKRALTDLSVPIVAGVSDKLLKLLIDFSEKKGLIWSVTPQDLVDTLADQSNKALHEYNEVTYVQQALLDYLSREDSVASLRKLPDTCKLLKELHLFPTMNGTLVDLDKPAYVAQDFKFPSVDFDVVLLEDGPSHKWRELYLLLEVPELSRSRLINEIILPGFRHLDTVARAKASTWLRDNLSLALSEDELDSDGLFEEIRNTCIVVCEDGELRAPMSIYHPESRLVRIVLGEQAAFPDMESTYSYKHERWLSFFRQLNVPTEPRLPDIVQYLRKLIDAETSYDYKKNRFQAVYEFLKERIETELQGKSDISDELSEALEEIAELPWIPIRQDGGDFICFKSPDVAFARPGEVYFPRVGQLVASQAYITVLRQEPNKRISKAMGFAMKPPLALVIKNFQEVLSACSSQDTMPNESALVKGLGQIYRFFGGEDTIEIDDLDEDIGYQESDSTMNLTAMFSKIPCIWDQNKKCFWRPDHVFMDNVLYMEPWRRTIRVREDRIESGYEALGRKQKPTIEDWKQVLREISEESGQLSEVKVIREVVRHIVEELVSVDATDGEVLVPTRNDNMLPAKTVFIADAPWYESRLDSWDIPILSSFVSGLFEIQRVLKIPSLAESIKERLIHYPLESDLEDESRECSRLEGLLRSNEFIHEFRRLLRHEGYEVPIDSLSYLYKVHVRCVKSIQTCLYLQFGGTEQLLGDAKTDFYWDQEELQAMITEKRRRYFYDDLAGMLNQALGDRYLKDLSPLVHVLRCEPSEISEVLDDLKIRKFMFDSDEKPEYEAEVDTQEFPYDENQNMDENEVSTPKEPTDLLSDSDEPMNDDEAEEKAIVSSTDNSNQGDLSDQPHGFSKSTSSIPREYNKVSNRSADGWPIGTSGSHNPNSTVAIESSSGTAGISDMERGQSTEATDGFTGLSTASSYQSAVQRRLLSYVSHGGREVDSIDTLSKDNSRSLRIGEAAVEIVINYEEKNGRKARTMAHMNPGYDVISECNGETRYIEVKGTELAWGERGVALSSTQFYYTRENPNRDFWLYIVENVFSQNPQIHMIHNPSKKVDYFVFDGGWRQVAESAEGKGIEIPIPSAGDEVLLSGNVVGIVESIVKAGKFPLIIYRAIDGSQQRKLLADVMVRAKEVI